ncbi:hypothetical protein FB451DRAFT_1168375 [Mycena latifolia]|nr:hypothetical protein FB451DRAFT_1168375 [Mycena latifolia]
MHTVVDIIPLLLHASLLFFFAGLVAFLTPINTVVTLVAGILLTVLAAIYSLLTILPLMDLDYPYRTPLSSARWRLIQTFPRVLPGSNRPVKQRKSTDSETMVEAMFRSATAPSNEPIGRSEVSFGL